MNPKPCKKVQFANEDAALFYIEKLQNTSKRKVVPHRAYLCEKCLTWHLTSSKTYHEQKLEEELDKLRKSKNPPAVSKKRERLETRVQQLTSESANKTKKMDKLHLEVYDLNRRLGRTLDKDTSYRWEDVKKYLDDPDLSWEKRFRNLEDHHIKEMEFRNKKDDEK